MKTSTKQNKSLLDLAGKRFKELHAGNELYENFWYSVARFFNYAFLVLFIITCASGSKEVSNIELTNYYWLIMFVLSPILSWIVINRTIKKHEFREWSKSERKKKMSFHGNLSLMVYTFNFAGLFIFCIAMSLLNEMEINDTMDKLLISIPFLSSMILIINGIFTVPLHISFFIDDLTLSKRILNQPDNWDWEDEDKSHYSFD